MLIDWFTVGAQALNFLILVWLMKRLLYKPIRRAIDERDRRIAGALADADMRKAEAQREREEFQQKNEEFEQQRAQLLSAATDEAKALGKRLSEEARQAATDLRARQREALRNEARNLYQTLSRRTQQEVFAITRKALADLATTSLEERLGEVFARRLRELDDGAKADLAAAIKAGPEAAVIRSAFALPAKQRAEIQKALNETLSADIQVRFERSPDLISGIELATNGQKVAWSIAGYLASLEESVDELLAPKNETKAADERRTAPSGSEPKSQ